MTVQELKQLIDGLPDDKHIILFHKQTDRSYEPVGIGGRGAYSVFIEVKTTHEILHQKTPSKAQECSEF